MSDSNEKREHRVRQSAAATRITVRKGTHTHTALYPNPSPPPNRYYTREKEVLEKPSVNRLAEKTSICEVGSE